MKLIGQVHDFFLVLLTGIFAFSSLGAVKYYQSNKINNDGSITISIVYSAPNSEFKQNNDLVGSLPFTQNLANSYFVFPGAEVQKALVYKDPNDSANRTEVVVELVVKDFSRISESKAFENIRASWEKTDTGAIYMWIMSPADLQKNLIETYHFVLTSDAEIKYTNGTVYDKAVNWFVYGNKDTYGAYFIATVDDEDMDIISSQGESFDTENAKDKPCGLFGMEFPFIIGSLIFVLSLREGKKFRFSLYEYFRGHSMLKLFKFRKSA